MAAAGRGVVARERLQEHHGRVMVLLDVPSILPLLLRENCVSHDDEARIRDTHYTILERTGFLLQSIYRQEPGAVDRFVQCLRQVRDKGGHAEILQLLEGGGGGGGAKDAVATSSPLMALLTEKADSIAARVNLIPLLNALLSSNALSLQDCMELQSAKRKAQENLHRLFAILERQQPGARGFIAFVEALRGDPSSRSHLELSQELLEEAKVFFLEHSQRGEVSNSDRIEVLQMASKPVIFDRDVQSKFHQLEQRLEQDLQLSSLLPYLQKAGVVSKEEVEQLQSVEPQARNRQLLLEIVGTKGAMVVHKFVGCLRESPEHRELAALFDAQPMVTSSTPPPPPPPLASSEDPPLAVGKKEKLAVLMYTDLYRELTDDYKLQTWDLIVSRSGTTADDKPASLTDVTANRQRLEQQLVKMGFEVVYFSPTHAPREVWRTTIAPMCSKDTILFLYISGIQYPYMSSCGEYAGAVLLKDATTISRRKPDSIQAEDIRSWIDALHCSATVVVDTYQSHAISFGKLSTATESMILENAWNRLTDEHSSTVVYSLRPDYMAMSRLGQVDIDKSYGLLTEKIVEALQFLKNLEDVSHRAFYEAISFHWNKRGPAHTLFSPAVQGDLDREFLGRDVIPYQQLFRADLKVSTEKKGKLKFNLSELQLPIGTMAGLILGDQFRISHVLCPTVSVEGRVTKAYPLHCSAEVKKEDRKKLEDVLTSIYGELQLSKDGSTEFLYLRKSFPLHQRTTVFPKELGQSGTDSLKGYIRERSLQLITVMNEGEAQVVVKKDGDLFVIVVRDDILYKAKLKSIQQVKSRLEMVAWSKYVRGLKNTQRPSRNHACYLTAERELLSPSLPRCNEFNLKWSTFQSPSSEAGHDAIVHFSEPPQRYWQPAPSDQSPVLEVEFRENYIITAIELRGDSEQNTFVSKVDIWRQKLVYSRGGVAGPSPQSPSPPIAIQSDDLARFVSLKPEVAKRFSISLKMWYRIPGGKSVRVDQVTILNWQFYLGRKTTWQFSPAPDASGRIKLSSTYQWIVWSGTAADSLTFDLGSPLTVEKIEFATIPNAPPPETLRLQLRTDWFKTSLPPLPSPLPKKHTFDQPLLLSNLQLVPMETVSGDATQTKPNLNVRAQLQVYGNKKDSPLEVEAGDLLTLDFLNMSDQTLFMFVLCIEETGMVDLVVSETVFGQTCIKKLLKTYIPKGYDRNTITDVYRVLVSAAKMYVEPFLQKGLHQYHEASCYNVCSYGHKPECSKDDWYEHSFKVNISR